MATDTLTIPYVRQGTDIHLALWLRSESEYAYWSGVTVRRVWMWSCEQKAFAGRCEIVGISSDETTLEVKWPHDKQMYVGLHSVVVELVMNGDVQTYDQKAVNMVRSTEDVEGDETIDVEAIPVGIVIAAITSGGSIPGPAGVKLYDGPGQNTDGAMTQKATTDAINESITEEVDPTVPAWAKQPTKPTYTAQEVGALPDSTPIPAEQVNADWNATSGKALILNKPDLSQFITKAVDDLTNYYLKSQTYSKTEVEQLIAAITTLRFVPVAVLPTASADTMNKIYLVPSSDPQQQNVKDEYFTTENAGVYDWEKFGSTAMSLDGYVTTEDLNTALASYVTSSAFNTALAAKQDVISDLATIRSGAAAGATAYQKPNTGIPQSDLAAAVVAVIQKAVANVSSNEDGAVVITLVNGDTYTIDLNHVHPQYYSKVAEDEQPSGGFLPDVVYKLGTITGSVTFALAAIVSGSVNHYFWTFDTDSTAPSVTWPSGITWADGTGPTVAANQHYEISVLDGIATFAEVSL